jgi:phosphotriesterase-related protein
MKSKNTNVRKAFFCMMIFLTASVFIGCNSQPVGPAKEPLLSTPGNSNWTGKIMTVNGLIPEDSIGITLPHEHLLLVHQGNDMDLTDEATAISELMYYAAAGGKTLTEVTNIGIGRNPEGLKRISAATGINIIMGAGFYKDKWIPDSIKNKSVQQLTDIITNDIINGINGIHSGVIGEIGISNPMTRFEKEGLAAVALAQKITGAAVNLHFDMEADFRARSRVLNILERKGADLTRVYISHCMPYFDEVDDFITYAKRGCYLSFDMFGFEAYEGLRNKFIGNPEPVKTIKALIDKGYLNQILISQDICVQALYVKNGGYGYAHILQNIVPQFKAAGLTDEQINTIMVENPKRILAFKAYSDI